MDPRRALSFGAAATSYDAGRPSYPADAVQWVLPPGAQRVLDLGAGTGKLTGAVRSLGVDTVAVEPDDAMRALIPGEALAGTAEEIPLPDASVDAVVAGQAFHWFDAERALPEMRRVLRPGGSIGLFWNLYDDRVLWVAELVGLYGAEDTVTVLAGMGPPFEGAPLGLAAGEQRHVPHAHPMTRDLLVENLRSRSPILLMPDEQRAQVLARARELAPAEELDLPYVCNTWRWLPAGP
jgi:SAM-dependent methyltransferase